MLSIRRRGAVIASASAVLALTLSGCGGNAADTATTVVETATDVATEVVEGETGAATAAPAETPAGTVGENPEVAAALEQGGNLVVWAWEPTLTAVVERFQEEHPNVTVQLTNAGGGDAVAAMTAVNNALLAGSGVPDVVQFEYQSLGQFTIQNEVADLSQFGADQLADKFSPGPWDAVTSNGHVFGLPMDSGPMALFYNADVFDEYGIEVPTTWDEYVEAARQLKAANPDICWTSDGNDPGYATSTIWQAGGQPFSYEGTTVHIDMMNDPGVQKYAELWQTMHDEDLRCDITGWTDEWFTALGNGTLVTLTTGAWMPANLQSGSPGAAGSWRVAPMPQFEAGQMATAESGGSMLSVMEASQNKALAYAFVEFANAGEGVGIRLDGGAFPATTADLNDPEFLNRPNEYFGGQAINQVLSESAQHVVQGFSYLPFQSYANSVFSDTVGQAFIGSGTIMDGIQAWQDRLHQFGETQGFTMQ